MNLDSVEDPHARRVLAKWVLERSQTEERFTQYGKRLLESKHEDVRNLAKERSW
jgi:hypothetical protein